jgi:hypothetical protein
MGRRNGVVTSMVASVLFAAGALLVPGPGTTGAVARSPDCPSPPVTIQKLIRLGAGSGSPDGLACYGGQLLTFRAYVLAPRYGDGAMAYSITPRWLDWMIGSSVALGTGPFDPTQPVSIVPWADAFVPPALGRCYEGDMATCPFRWYWGRWVAVSAHFDGPVARTCRIAEQAEGANLTARDAVAECRTRLIVLSVGSFTPPDTATAGVPSAGWVAPQPALLPVGVFVLASLLVAGRLPRRRR